MFYDLIDEMSKVFDEPFFSSTVNTTKYSVPSFPPVRVVQRENKVTFKFALAGYSKEDIQIKFEKDSLVLSTTEKFNKSEAKKDSSKVLVDNFKTPSFSYKYFIPNDRFDFDKAEASFENGVLFVSMPAKDKKEIKPKIIEIK